MTDWVIPCLLAGVAAAAMGRRTDVYGALTDGAAEGLRVLGRILPALVVLLSAVQMFRASGAMELLTGLLSPVLEGLGIPPETAVLLLVRPVSGSGALAVGSQLMEQYGPDSYIGRVTAVMLGCSETTFYTVAVYYGAAGIRRTRHTVPAALAADAAAFVAAAWAGVLSVRPALPVVGQTKGGWGLVVPSLLLYLDRFSGLICRWAVSGAALPQATQQQILVVNGLPAAQGRHKVAQTAGDHQCAGTAQQEHPCISQWGGQCRQQNGKSRIPWVQPPAAQARRCAAGNALARHRHNGPSRICRQKETGIPRQKHHGPEYQPQPAAHAPAVQGGAQHDGNQNQ